LKQDEVRFVVIPVFSNTHLVAEVNKLESNSETIRSMVFLNCGGFLNLTSLWFYKVESISAYLLDSHRPYCHLNVIDPENRIYIIDDGCKSLEECPSQEDFMIYQQLKQQLAEDDEDDE
jgi:hypothetical protein